MHTPHNIIEYTRVKILVCALECQVSWSVTDDGLVGQY